MIHPDRTGWGGNWERSTTMDAEMIENFTTAARAQMDALLAEAKDYEAKRAKCLAGAERLRVALIALGGTAPAMPPVVRARRDETTRKRARVVDRAPDGEALAAVLRYAASAGTFTHRDAPCCSRNAASNARARGYLCVVDRVQALNSPCPLSVYQITDKGRAWLAAYESKGAK